MRKQIHSGYVDQLLDALLLLESREEYLAFLADICTVNELNSLAQRFEVGSRLLLGQTYQEIAKATGASTATISRVNRLLGDEHEGLELAAARLGKTAAKQGED